MKSFLAFFDLSFSKFVSINVIRVLFCAGAIMLTVGTIYMNLEHIPPFFSGGYLAELIYPTFVWLILLISLRVSLELYVALIRIAENSTKLVKLKEWELRQLANQANKK